MINGHLVQRINMMEDYCAGFISWEDGELGDKLPDILNFVAETSLKCKTDKLWMYDDGSLNWNYLIAGANTKLDAAEVIMKEEVIDPMVRRTLDDVDSFERLVINKISEL